MFRKMSLALLAGVSCLGFSDSALAIDASPLPEPTVIYARSPAQPAPVRTAYAERSQMGGGFIEFLFGDGPQQGGRYQQQPAYQPQPDYQQQPGYGYGGRRGTCRRWIRSIDAPAAGRSRRSGATPGRSEI